MKLWLGFLIQKYFYFPKLGHVGLLTFIKEICVCVSIHFLSETAVYETELATEI